MLLKEINRAVQDLINSGALDQAQNLSVPNNGSIQVVDLFPIFKNLFSPAALKTLNNKATTMVHQYNEPTVHHPVIHLLAKLNIKSAKERLESGSTYTRQCDVIQFFGSRANRASLYNAISKVIANVNEVADLGFTKVSLAPLLMIPLALMPNMEQEFVVVSYISLTKAGEDHVNKNMKSAIFKEGAMPDRVENQV